MFSVTQGVNFAQIGVAVGIIIRIVNDPGSVTPEEWQIVGLALLGIVASITSALNRYSKGDINVAGVRK
jgi:hypothetical protein